MESHPFVEGLHGVRYQVKDVARAREFYTRHLGFKLEHQHLPAFASVSLGDAQILLSGPEASGSRPVPDGTPGARRMESRGARSLRSQGLHRGVQESRLAVSE